MSDESLHPALNAQALHERLESLVYMVLSVRRSVRAPARELAGFAASDQWRFLRAVELIRNTSDELAYNFVTFAAPALRLLHGEDWDQWVFHVMSRYDQGGVLAAIVAMQKVNEYAETVSVARFRVRFEEVARQLEGFVLGLNGRVLRLIADESVWTDTESLYLPPALTRFPDRADNRRLYKAMAVHLWAQTWFGTWRCALAAHLARFPDPQRAAHRFHLLETLRLDACVARDLPGMYRELCGLRAAAGATVPEGGPWGEAARRLAAPGASVDDSLALSAQLVAAPELPLPAPYQGHLDPERVEHVRGARLARERAELAQRLVELESEQDTGARKSESQTRVFHTLREAADDMPEGFRVRLAWNGEPVAPRPDVQRVLDSIVQDLGELPEDYLAPAGPGGYRAQHPPPVGADRVPEAGPGAYRYDEWDFMRQRYRSDWCLLHEKDAHPLWDDFVERTRGKYAGLLKHLRRTFEAVRGGDRRLRRQPYGDDLDLDALVEAYADRCAGRDDRGEWFIKRRRVDRDIAVLFLVDMSGSTKGWVNDLEREALVLLCEALETLGDRYGIYGFSGFTHRRCELFRIKCIDEPYSDAVRARIGGIRPQDYTRMGVAIRHLTRRFREIEARTRLLITLSDGRPDDQDGYRGPYGIEDTRQALIEARASGVHPYCVTIDEQALEYLPHMFGPAGFTVVSDVHRLPYRVSDIYRRITA